MPPIQRRCRTQRHGDRLTLPRNSARPPLVPSRTTANEPLRRTTGWGLPGPPPRRLVAPRASKRQAAREITVPQDRSIMVMIPVRVARKPRRRLAGRRHQQLVQHEELLGSAVRGRLGHRPPPGIQDDQPVSAGRDRHQRPAGPRDDGQCVGAVGQGPPPKLRAVAFECEDGCALGRWNRGQVVSLVYRREPMTARTSPTSPGQGPPTGGPPRPPARNARQPVAVAVRFT